MTSANHAFSFTTDSRRIRIVGAWGATAYHFWKRGRWSAILIAFCAAICLIIKAAAPHADWLVGVGVLSLSTMMFAGAHLVGVFTYGGRDLGATESGFPRYLLVLPITSRKLALIPMVFGSAAMAALWIILAKIVVDRMLITIPDVWAPWWPAMMLVAVIAWLQAVSWTPFWFPFVRVAVALGTVGGLVAFGILARHSDVSSAVVTAVYLLATVAAYPAAVAGLSRTRRGDGVRAPWLRDVGRTPRPIKPESPFASPMAAQVWLEVHRNILMIPCVSAAIPLLLATTTLISSHSSASVDLGVVQFQPILIVLIVSLCAPVFAAALHGLAFGKSDAWSIQVAILPFIATRPLTDAQIVAAKLWAAAIATVVSWSLVIVILFGWSLFPNVLGPGQSIIGFVARHLSWTIAIGSMCVLAWLIFTTWKQMAQSLFISMYGRKWLTNVVTVGGIVVFSVISGAAIIVGHHESLRHALPAMLRWFVYVWVALKLTAGIGLFSICLRQGLLTGRRVMELIYYWLVLVAIYFLVLFIFLPDSMKPGLVSMICIAAVLPPGARALAALPALHANRHRS